MKHLTLSLFTAILLSACAGPPEPDLDEAAGELTAAQCGYFDVNGKVQICHRTSSATRPYTIIRVAEQACIDGHAGHAGDYVTSTDPSSPLYDPTCQGLGCLPETAPCDATVPCCDGLTCNAGTCVVAEIDECAPAPCVNGACTDGDGSYTCACDPGWEGTNCDVEIDECRTNPCVHGECSDLVNGYTCACLPGWAGTNCDVDIDECRTDPCVNGDCIDVVNGYTCACLPGWEGTNCDVELPVCLPYSAPCDANVPCCGGFTCVNDFFGSGPTGCCFEGEWWTPATGCGVG